MNKTVSNSTSTSVATMNEPEVKTSSIKTESAGSARSDSTLPESNIASLDYASSASQESSNANHVQVSLSPTKPSAPTPKLSKNLRTREWPPCPVETTLTLIGSKWKVLVLRELAGGTKRFGELQRGVGGVSQKVLTSQLRAMEEDGLVHREVFAEVPPRVEYSLTPLGQSLTPVIDTLRIWGEEFKAQLQN